jgi:hypothetical protein
MIIGAPFSLEVEYIEVKVLILRQQVVNQSNFDILYRVSEGAIIIIFTLLNFIWKEMTEFGFVLVLVI